MSLFGLNSNNIPCRWKSNLAKPTRCIDIIATCPLYHRGSQYLTYLFLVISTRGSHLQHLRIQSTTLLSVSLRNSHWKYQVRFSYNIFPLADVLGKYCYGKWYKHDAIVWLWGCPQSYTFSISSVKIIIIGHVGIYCWLHWHRVPITKWLTPVDI